jgi:predicted DNA binding CopG/RHH family protein
MTSGPASAESRPDKSLGMPPALGLLRPHLTRKRIPKFRSEKQEREFWSKADSTEYLDWRPAKRVVLPNLKPSQKTISLRRPAMMLAELKRLANKRDVPYQSLMKVFIAERLSQELGRQD